MVNFNLMPVLLCAFSWISSTVTQFYTVEVQPGEEVTLQCSNFSTYPGHIYWFKMTDRPNTTSISSMFSPDRNASLYVGFQNGKFNMTSNTTVLFLKIKQVNSSDSGLYFCGEYKDKKTIISSGTYVKVQEVSDGLTNLSSHINLTSVILGGLTVFLLLVIIGLVVKIRKLHAAQDDRQNPQHSENVDSDAMNYAALSFHHRAKIRRPAPQRELETNVVYAATR